MSIKEDLRKIIREEVTVAVLREQAVRWWQAPAKAEHDAHLQPHLVHEQDMPPNAPDVGSAPKKRVRLKRGQRKSKRTGKGVYTSAGTLPSSQPDKAGRPAKSKVDPAKRKAEGEKLFNLYQRGGSGGGRKTKDPKAIKFRKYVDKRAKDEYGAPVEAKEKNSVIWAVASMKSRVASNIDAGAAGAPKSGRTKIRKPGGKKRRAASRKAKRDRLKAAATAAAQKAAAKANKKSTP